MSNVFSVSLCPALFCTPWPNLPVRQQSLSLIFLCPFQSFCLFCWFFFLLLPRISRLQRFICTSRPQGYSNLLNNRILGNAKCKIIMNCFSLIILTYVKTTVGCSPTADIFFSVDRTSLPTSTHKDWSLPELSSFPIDCKTSSSIPMMSTTMII